MGCVRKQSFKKNMFSVYELQIVILRFTRNLIVCFYDSIKIHDLSDLKEMFAIINMEDERGLDVLNWSDDGQLLAVSTQKGNLHVYLTRLPMLASAHQTRIAHLTSLLEVTIEDNVQQVLLVIAVTQNQGSPMTLLYTVVIYL